jgi:hypothetical protein
LVTADANNTKGSVVDLLGAPVSHDVELLYIGINYFNSSGVNVSALMDIMIDPAGGTDWTLLIPNLLVGWTGTSNIGNGIFFYRTYAFPIQIPSGATIGARAQTSHTSDITGRVTVYCIGGNSNPGSWWAGTSVEAIGVDTDNSIGQMHTGGNSGSFSSWTNLGGTTSSETYAVQWAVQGENDNNASSGTSYQFEFGSSSTIIGPPVFTGTNFLEAMFQMYQMPIFRTASSGTQLQVRAASMGTAQPLDVAAYVVS